MLTIPATYYNNNEDYITLTAIRSFMRNHPEGKFKVSFLEKNFWILLLILEIKMTLIVRLF